MDKQEMLRRESKALEWLIPALEHTFNAAFTFTGNNLCFEDNKGIQHQIKAVFDGVSYDFKLGNKVTWNFVELCFYIRDCGLEFKTKEYF